MPADHREHADPAATADEQWWRSAVVYQIYPRSFADSDGDGIGDLGGIEQHLDHLVELGVGVLWLSPIYPSPQDDNGYDIADYQGVDPMFGTLDGFDRLLGAIHERGLKLIMDLVVNHTSDEHPWFVESRSSKDSPKRDWYWWRPPGVDGAPPNRWQSAFSGSTWEYDETTGECYLHLFSRKQPDLNWENPEVRDAIHAMMRWWLDRGVDGFRMDVINMIAKDPALPDDFVPAETIHAYLQEMHAAVFAGRSGLLTVGEMPGVTVEQARRFTDPARRELDMVFQFEHMEVDQQPGRPKWDLVPFSLPLLKASLGRWQTGLADVGWNSLYWNNHDQPRVVSHFGDDGEHRVASAKLLGTVLHLHRGTPYVYQGEELGMTNAPLAAITDFRDIESINHYAVAGDDALPSLRIKGRDNARTPMQWSSDRHAGFTTGEPWIAVNPNHTTINADAARRDPDSVFHHYRRLIAMRRDEPAIAHGDFTMLAADHERLYAFTRSFEGTTLLVVANWSGTPLTLTDTDVPGIADWLTADLLVGSGSAPVDATTPTLSPWEARLYRRRG